MAIEGAKATMEKATKLEMAKAFKEQGVDIKMIATVTGLKHKEIKEL